MKHILALLRTASFCSPLSSNLAPKASIKSAAPHLLDTLRLPCFATGIACCRNDKTRCSEMLNVFASSPQVPTISQQYLHEGTEPAFSRITSAKAVTLINSRPLAAKAHKKPAIGTSATSPLIILFIVSLARS